MTKKKSNLLISKNKDLLVKNGFTLLKENKTVNGDSFYIFVNDGSFKTFSKEDRKDILECSKMYF